jgi:hypothetical protein
LHDSFELLRLYAPNLHKCANRSRTDAKSISKKYDQRWASMARALEDNGVFTAMTCIFDLLWNVSENDDDAIKYLSFIDSTVRRALDAAEGAARTQLEKLIITMIVSFGEERSEYKNHFAEIAVVEKLMTIGGFRLECVERLLPNGNRMDFEISRDGVQNLIEVYNIDFDTEKLNCSEDLKQFLEKRLVDKLTAKLEGVGNIGKRCQLVPVLWGDIMSLVKYLEAFEYFKQTTLVAPFMMFARYTHQLSGEVVYDFGTVEQFLLRVKNRAEGRL